MLRRLEIRELPVIVEWDEETGEVTLGLGAERELAWARFGALNQALARLDDDSWMYVVEEVRERVSTTCQGNMALVWRATFVPPYASVKVAEIVAAAAGMEL